MAMFTRGYTRQKPPGNSSTKWRIKTSQRQEPHAKSPEVIQKQTAVKIGCSLKKKRVLRVYPDLQAPPAHWNVRWWGSCWSRNSFAYHPFDLSRGFCSSSRGKNPPNFADQLCWWTVPSTRGATIRCIQEEIRDHWCWWPNPQGRIPFIIIYLEIF